MLDSILASFRNHPSLEVIEKSLKSNRKANVHGLGGSSGAFLAVSLLGADPDSHNRIRAKK